MEYPRKGLKMLNYEFNTSDTPELNITVGCDVVFATGNNYEVTVTVDGNGIDVYQNNNAIFVKHQNTGASIRNVVIGDIARGSIISVGNIRSGRNINISGGTITINGKRINLSDLTDTPEMPVPKVYITAPIGSFLELNVNDTGSVYGDVEFYSAYISASNNAEVNLTIQGQVQINASNNAAVCINGPFETVTAIASNNAVITTVYDCTGDYNATASNNGCVTHHGIVNGRVRSRENNNGSVRI